MWRSGGGGSQDGGGSGGGGGARNEVVKKSVGAESSGDGGKKSKKKTAKQMIHFMKGVTELMEQMEEIQQVIRNHTLMAAEGRAWCPACVEAVKISVRTSVHCA